MSTWKLPSKEAYIKAVPTFTKDAIRIPALGERVAQAESDLSASLDLLEELAMTLWSLGESENLRAPIDKAEKINKFLNQYR